MSRETVHSESYARFFRHSAVLSLPEFSLYYGPLEDVIRAHGIDTRMYADDCQLYIIIKRSNRRVALDQLELCIVDVLRWNTQNGLK